jgi:hypothetical protein
VEPDDKKEKTLDVHINEKYDKNSPKDEGKKKKQAEVKR